MPRSTIFDFMRPTIWGCLLIYIRNNTPNRFKKIMKSVLFINNRMAFMRPDGHFYIAKNQEN